MQFALKKPKSTTLNIKEFVQMYREPVITYSITPSNAPEAEKMIRHFLASVGAE